jgi:uncharacterized protein
MSEYNVLGNRGEKVGISGNDIPTFSNKLAFNTRGFVINGIYYTGSILVFPKRVLMWKVPTFKDLSLASLAPIATMWPKTRLLFVGTGKRLVPLPSDVSAYFKERGISVEPLSTVKRKLKKNL